MKQSETRKTVDLLTRLIDKQRAARGVTPKPKVSPAIVSSGGDANRTVSGGPASYATIKVFGSGPFSKTTFDTTTFEGVSAKSQVKQLEWVSGAIIKSKTISPDDLKPSEDDAEGAQ